MISSFWNLCRACPSVPVEKLHSEYRSTFQWHEYVGSRSDTSINHPTVVKQPTQAPQPHVFWSGGKDSGGASIDQERRGKRHDFSSDRASHGWWLRSAEQVRSQSQRRGGYHKQETLSGDGEGASGPRKSLSMGTIRAFETSVPVHKQKLHDISNSADAGGGVKPSEETQNIVINTTKGPSETLEWSDHRDFPEKMSSSFEADKPSDFGRKEYKSEYKKQFRPFSQYEYVDGRFLKKKGDQESGSGSCGSPWYKEVIELRKKAGEYRYRGWGTELVPQHLAEVYHQSLWDQVSKRSSLAALALITTTTQKSISKEEKDKENARKSQPKRSLSRPNTATPKHPISDLEKSKSRDLETVHGSKKKPYEGPVSTVAGRVARGKARSQSAGPGGRSPRKGTRQSMLSKDRGEIEAHKPMQRHPRPSSADPSLGFSEPVIKSPPEPTRVKSPEQVILRSPDPVNWTVPLDTTKSFTVTQNIRDAPPSPRFRAGDRLHGVESRSGHHQLSGQQSSAGSTKASSPLSSFSTRSAVAHTHTAGHHVTKSALLQDAHKASVKGKEKENHIAGMVKAPASSGGGGGSTGGPLKVSGENKMLGSSHSTVNGFDEKKKLQAIKPVAEKSKVEMSRVKEKKTTAAAPTAPPTKTDTAKPSSLEQSTAPASRPSEALASKPVPGTTLRCLEDPSFVFDAVAKDVSVEKLPNVPQKTTTSDSSVAKKSTSTGLPKPIAAGRSSIQVLEAPAAAPMPSTSEKLGFVPPAPVTTTKRSGLVGASQVSALPPSQPRLPTYRVLDAPDPADYGNPSSAAGRNKATDVIEKARNRFDKFWGKSKDDEK